MKLNTLIAQIRCELYGNTDCDIEYLCLNSKKCKKGSVFFCMKGNNADGADYIDEAIVNGAVVIVADRKLNVKIPLVIVKDVRKAMGIMCNVFYGSPQKKLKTVAIVGTNGKTTVCELISNVMNSAGIKCGSIGTMGVRYGDCFIENTLTTPDTTDLYELLYKMVQSDVKVVCMELSAHAIYYKKADFPFDITVFTNCSRDHLDFFKDEQSYAMVKLSAFNKKNSRISVVNFDDALGQTIYVKRSDGTISYGLYNPADVFAVDLDEDQNGSRFVMNLFDCLYDIKSSLIGKFNVYNMLAVATTCALLGVKTDFIADKLNVLKPVNGRMERVVENKNIFIDYAHTPDALKNALISLTEIKNDKKLICVFGCGGNRDKGKRALMGKISGEFADFTIITTDNPRFEDESEIIRQIERGIRKVTDKYITVSDRKKAIEYALNICAPDDYVLIAGKGSEEYQEVMGLTHYYSDKETVYTVIEGKNE